MPAIIAALGVAIDKTVMSSDEAWPESTEAQISSQEIVMIVNGVPGRLNQSVVFVSRNVMKSHMTSGMCAKPSTLTLTTSKNALIRSENTLMTAW